MVPTPTCPNFALVYFHDRNKKKPWVWIQTKIVIELFSTSARLWFERFGLAFQWSLHNWTSPGANYMHLYANPPCQLGISKTWSSSLKHFNCNSKNNYFKFVLTLLMPLKFFQKFKIRTRASFRPNSGDSLEAMSNKHQKLKNKQ